MGGTLQTLEHLTFLGSFAAQVKGLTSSLSVACGSKNKWYLFDDETVSSVDDLNAPDRYDDEEETGKKTKKTKPKAGFTRLANGDVFVLILLDDLIVTLFSPYRSFPDCQSPRMPARLLLLPPVQSLADLTLLDRAQTCSSTPKGGLLMRYRMLPSPRNR